MPDLTTRYLGLTLSNPVIAGSSGLTQSLDGVRRCADAGAGAVVLKSIFEEEILGEVDRLVAVTGDVTYQLEAEEYLNRFGREDAMSGYLQLIRDAKKAVSVPVIASINCTTTGGWVDFARHMEQAGADGLELNVFLLPADADRDGVFYERTYFEIAEQVTKAVSIPVALKVGPYFSSLVRTLSRLSRTGIKGLVLFNRFYRIDFDIEAMTLTSGTRLSAPEEMEVPLRWISILSGTAGCDLAATTGVHDGAGVVKQLLAGAAAVQVCSALYRDGEGSIGAMLADVSSWMDRHGFTELPQFKGRLRQRGRENPAAYERVQFAREMAEPAT
jgi:dihydroorotate dehydrogenase (fumarate)